MIKCSELSPNIYYRESRDFQYFGHLYDLLFNYIKTNTDLMENFPINQHTDSKLIELLARTLGFQNKSDFRNDDLNAICSVFVNLMKNKGTLNAIKILVRTILRTAQVKCDVDNIVYVNKDTVPFNIVILIPNSVSNSEIKLLEEVLDYIVPAGCFYSIVNAITSTADLLTLNVDTYVENRQIVYKNNEQITNEKLMETKANPTHSGTSRNKEIVNPKVGDIRFSKLNKGE